MIPGARKRENKDRIEYRLRFYHRSLVLHIDRLRCIHCDICSLVCPHQAMRIEADEHGLEIYLDENRCVLCEACAYFCPADAIQLKYDAEAKELLRQSSGLPVMTPRIELDTAQCPVRCEAVADLLEHWCRQQRRLVENQDEECPKRCFHCLETCPREVFTQNGEQVAADPRNCLRCTACLERCEHGSLKVNPLFEGKIILDADRCPDDCDKCFQVCPVDVFERRDGRVTLKRDQCAFCGACVNVCDQDALVLERRNILLPEGDYCLLWNRLRQSLLRLEEPDADHTLEFRPADSKGQVEDRAQTTKLSAV